MNTLGWERLTASDKAAILSGIAAGEARGGPYHVEIHPTDRCNSRCFFCSTRRRREKAEIPLPLYLRFVDEMRRAGTRSVCLSGGGEPLAHREAPALIAALNEAGLALGNLTTNGVGLDAAVASALVRGACDQVIVSLNCAEEEGYARMMQVNRRAFRFVTDNLRRFNDARRGRRGPRLVLQFLVTRDNFRTLPRMAALARELEADGILFNGLSFLPTERRMDAGERAAMLDLFETILREDEYRRILGINSYEQDLGPDIERIEARVGRERESRPRWARLLHLLARRDFTLAEKWEHHLRMRRRRRVKEDLRTRPELCLRPWFGMTVRSDGAVPVCCARQDRLIADAGATPLPAIWRSEPFVAFRAQMRALWNGAAVPERGWVSPRCAPGAQGVERCPFRSHYYREDRRFFERLHAIARRPSAA